MKFKSYFFSVKMFGILVTVFALFVAHLYLRRISSCGALKQQGDQGVEGNFFPKKIDRKIVAHALQ
jgi:hypothetical protein